MLTGGFSAVGSGCSPMQFAQAGRGFRSGPVRTGPARPRAAKVGAGLKIAFVPPNRQTAAGAGTGPLSHVIINIRVAMSFDTADPAVHSGTPNDRHLDEYPRARTLTNGGIAMNERTWLRRGLFAGALALGLAAVPGTLRAQDAAKSDDANKQDSAQPAAGAQQGQGQGRRGRGGPGGPGGGFGLAARNPTQAVDRMREETSALKLRDDQKTKLDAIFKEAETQAKTVASESESLQGRERAQKVMGFTRDLREKVNGVLTEEQRQTLRKNQATLMAKQMVENYHRRLGELDLTADQKTKVDAVLADAEKKATEAAAQAQPADGQGQGGGRGGPMAEVMRDTREKINQILTPEQQQKLQASGPGGGRGQGGGRRGGQGGAGAGAGNGN